MIPPTITLVAVDTIDRWRTMPTFIRTARHVNCSRLLFFTNDRYTTVAGIEFVQCDVQSLEAYNAWIIKELARYIETDFALIVQWDSWVVNPDAWSEDFLRCDCIGATWPPEIHPEYNVGNGGFCLRSKRFLDMMAADVDVFEGQFFPEDLRLCRDLRQHFEGKGIKYAPADVAARFCFERHPHRPVYDGAFAVHGLLNFKDWLR